MILTHVSGNFSQVKLGVSKETGKRCALKYVDKSLVKNKPELLKNEVDILFKVKHKNVIGLLDLFDTEKNMILVMELYVTSNLLFWKL